MENTRATGKGRIQSKKESADQLNRVLAEIHDTSKIIIDAVTQALTAQEQTEDEEAAECEDDDLAISGFAM